MSSKKQESIPVRHPGLMRAVEAAGGWAALARALQKTRGGIWQWKQVPAERVLAVERATGVSRHQLRPDLYPEESVSRP